jgi:hypothetical protein
MKIVKSQNSRQNATALHYLSWPTPALLVGGAFVFLLLGLFMPGRATSLDKVGGAVLAEPCVREGRITKVENGVAEFETAAGERFMLNPVSEGFRVPEIGSLQRVALLPFRRSADQVYLARIRTMRKISQYSSESAGGS